MSNEKGRVAMMRRMEIIVTRTMMPMIMVVVMLTIITCLNNLDRHEQ